MAPLIYISEIKSTSESTQYNSIDITRHYVGQEQIERRLIHLIFACTLHLMLFVTNFQRSNDILLK